VIERLTDSSWPTVAWHPSGHCDARMSGATLIVRVNGAEVWRSVVGPMRWLWCAANPAGDVRVIGTRETETGDHAFLIAQHDLSVDYGPAYGMRPCALTWEDKQWTVYIVTGARHYRRNGTVMPTPFQANGSVAGMRYIADGFPVWNELPTGGYVETIRHDRVIRFPVFQPGVIVGQEPGVDRIVVATDDGVTTVLGDPERDGTCYESQAALRDDGTIVVCARTQRGCAFVSGPPWPTIEQPAPIPDPIPAPQPVPDPEVPHMRLPDDVFAALVRERAKYQAPVPNDSCVAIMNAVAGQFSGWGLLHKPNGNNGKLSDGTPCSVDFLVYRPTMQGFDVFSDAGGETKPQQTESEETFPVERFVAPIGGQPVPEPQPVPVPVPVPQPTPGPTLSDVLMAVRLLTSRVDALTADTAGIDDKIDALISQHAMAAQIIDAKLDRKYKGNARWIGSFTLEPVQ
jgi:hypothetical protein